MTHEQERNTPVKTSTSGYRMGLSVLVRINPEEYYVTNLASFGFKVSSGNQSKHFCGITSFCCKVHVCKAES
jgi:hypothetical protein